MYQLHIANKNYSSWSLRPWLLMKELNIPFEEVLHPFGDEADWQAYRQLSPTGQVPCLVKEQQLIWDSLAIIEYLAEHHEGVWPADPDARAWARCAASEMHSGFTTLRSICSMTCGVTIELKERPEKLVKDIERIVSLWNEGLDRFGGPFLAGERVTAVDAFFAPVVFRFRTYDIEVTSPAMDYMRSMMGLDSMQAWYQAALAEPFRDWHHEEDMTKWGTIIEDRRKT